MRTILSACENMPSSKTRKSLMTSVSSKHKVVLGVCFVLLPDEFYSILLAVINLLNVKTILYMSLRKNMFLSHVFFPCDHTQLEFLGTILR